MEMSRLRWQCRRGMRELDQLLVTYLERHYANASDAEKSAFSTLLSLSDPELIGYMLQKEQPAPELVGVVQRILDRTES
jgi:antitoxin CptB